MGKNTLRRPPHGDLLSEEHHAKAFPKVSLIRAARLTASVTEQGGGTHIAPHYM